MATNPLRDPTDALRFVLDFAQMDLTSASTQAIRTVERRVQAFINRETIPGWRDAPSLDLKVLRFCQERSFEILADVARRRRWIAHIDLFEVGFWIVREPAEIRLVARGAPNVRFLYQLARVLEATDPDTIRLCPACARLFFRVTRKRFCSAKCQSRIYMRKYRAGEVGGL